MGRSKKVLLLSHIPQRDELVDMNLASYLASKDVCVWKYPILGKSRDMICMVKPDIVILPEIRIEFTGNMAELCKQWGIRVIQKSSWGNR